LVERLRLEIVADVRADFHDADAALRETHEQELNALRVKWGDREFSRRQILEETAQKNRQLQQNAARLQHELQQLRLTSEQNDLQYKELQQRLQSLAAEMATVREEADRGLDQANERAEETEAKLKASRASYASVCKKLGETEHKANKLAALAARLKEHGSYTADVTFCDEDGAGGVQPYSDKQKRYRAHQVFMFMLHKAEDSMLHMVEVLDVLLSLVPMKRALRAQGRSILLEEDDDEVDRLREVWGYMGSRIQLMQEAKGGEGLMAYQTWACLLAPANGRGSRLFDFVRGLGFGRKCLTAARERVIKWEMSAGQEGSLFVEKSRMLSRKEVKYPELVHDMRVTWLSDPVSRDSPARADTHTEHLKVCVWAKLHHVPCRTYAVIRTRYDS
jgi:hypothetical protein